MAIGKLNNLHREKGRMRSKPYRLVSNWSAATRCIVYRGVTSRRRTGGTTRGQREHTSVISHQLAASAERCVYARVLRARAGFSPIQHSLGGGTHRERERQARSDDDHWFFGSSRPSLPPIDLLLLGSKQKGKPSMLLLRLVATAAWHERA